MGRIKFIAIQFIAIAICLVVGLTECVGPSVAEPQARQKDTRLARMYFLREKGLFGAVSGGMAGLADIKVNGTKVGTVVMGSYFFVDRPPGTYKLSSETSLSSAYETEVQLDAGKTYYFGVGRPRGGGLLIDAVSGSSGQQMRATSPLMAGFAAAALFRLEPAAGAAAIAQLKAP